MQKYMSTVVYYFFTYRNFFSSPLFFCQHVLRPDDLQADHVRSDTKGGHRQRGEGIGPLRHQVKIIGIERIIKEGK